MFHTLGHSNSQSWRESDVTADTDVNSKQTNFGKKEKMRMKKINMNSYDRECSTFGIHVD